MSRPKEKIKPAPKPKEKVELEAPKKPKLLNKEREALKKLLKQIETKSSRPIRSGKSSSPSLIREELF